MENKRMRIEVEITPADLDALIAEQWQFAGEAFTEDFRSAGCREGFERILEEPLERLARFTMHPVTLHLLAGSFDLVRQAARTGLALVEARDRQLVEGGGR